MKVLIDIPEEAYNLLQNDGVDWLDTKHILDRVAKGTPLPKGHGDLIDRRELKKYAYGVREWNGHTYRIIHEATVDDAQAIIEADKGSENIPLI